MTTRSLRHALPGVPSHLRRAGALAVASLSLAGTGFAGIAPAQAAISPHHARLGLLARSAMDLAARGQRISSDRALSRDSAAGPVYGVFLRGRTTAAAIASTGARPGTVLAVGSTADATLAQLQALAQLPGVTEVDLAGRASRQIDQSVPKIHASEPAHAATAGVPHLWSGTSAGGFSGDTGKGVVVGVVDSGIDLQNADFMTGPGATRITRLWDQAASGSGPKPSGFTYGRDCSQDNINSATCGPFDYLSVALGGDCTTPNGSNPNPQTLPEEDCIGHGTHVAGIAAANGRAGTAGQYIGVAPEADLVIVKNDGDLAHVVDGVHFVFQRAAILGEPASVNLSLGVSSGPHDGTSAFETMLDALSAPGHLITVAAGNEGTRGAPGSSAGGLLWYHASGSLGPGQVQSNNLVIGAAPVAFDIWYNAGNQLSITVNGPGGFHLGPVAPDRTGAGIGPDGVCESANPNATVPTAKNAGGDEIQVLSCTQMPNGDSEIQFFILNPTNADLHVNGCKLTPCVDTWSFQLQAGGSGPTVGYHAWAFSQSDYAIHNSQGNDFSTLSAPASAHNVISAGSLAARNTWPAGGGPRSNSSTVGALSFFSAFGPTRDGRPGIDLVGPGENVGSSLSSASTSIRSGCEFPNATPADCVTPDGAHLFISGTSMASPHAAGAVALMLAQQPSMTVDQARRALGDSALLDGFTGPTPDPTQWGAGKLQLGPGALTMTPSQGSVAGGNTVDVVGFDFQGGMTIQVNGSPVTVTPVGTNHVQFTMPPAPGGQPGKVAVLFTNPDTSTGTDAYSYLAPGPLQPTPPTRISDTRTGSGKPNAGGTIGPNGSLTVQVTGTFGPTVIPSGASAAVINLAVTNTSSAGNLVIWASGAPRPGVSNINWAAGHTVSNLTEVPLSSSGQVDLFNNGPGFVDVILDVNGYYTLTTVSGDALHPLLPERLADTRPASGQPYASSTIGPRGQLAIQIDGALLAGNVSSGIPSTGVDAVVLELTATNATSASNLVVFPGCEVPLNQVPLASNLNFAAGQTLANRAITQVSRNNCGAGQTANGYVTIFNNTSAGSTDVVVDTGGWFQALSGAGGLFVPVTPARVVDTRPSSHSGAFYTIAPNTTRKIQVAGHASVPAMGLGLGQSPTATVLHVTTVFPHAAGFLISYPTGPQPNAADLNFAGGDVVGNLVQVTLAADGTILLTNDSTGYTDVVIDIEGWYT